MTFTHKPVRVLRLPQSTQTFRSLFLLLFTLMAGAGTLLAQQISALKPDSLKQIALKDSVLLRIMGLPALAPLNAHELATPRYDYFWLYGDGNFTLGGTDSTISHRYQLKPSANELKTYPTGLYGGGGKPPPKIVRGEATVNSAPYPNSAPHQVTPAVKENQYIRLQKNHLSLVPDDTTVWVLSYKNIYKPGVSLNGDLYLFFNSPIERVQVDPRSGDTTIVLSEIAGIPQFGSFKNDTTLFYFPNTLKKTIQLSPGTFAPGSRISQSFKNALLWRFDTLAFNEERHLFIQFKNDPNLLTKFPDKEQGRVQFLAMMTSNQGGVNLSPSKAALVERLGVNEVLTPNSLESILGQIFTQLDPQGQNPPSTFIIPPSSNLMDLQLVTSSLSKAHDPNQMRVDACACPAGGDGAQKLLCTVDFVNDGHVATSNVYVTVHFPEGVDVNSISDEPFRIHPALQAAAVNSRVEMERNVAENTITWKMLNFAIHSVWEYGEGHPMTYGQIVFNALTKAGTNLEDLGEIVACIRFDDPNGTAVCTVPVKPVALVADGSTASIEAQAILQCDACRSEGDIGMPLWLILLLVLIIGLSLWIVYTEST